MARTRTGGIATESVNAEAAETAAAHRTSGSVFASAGSRAVARTRCARAHSVVVAHRHVRASPERCRDVARAAIRGARRVATNAVDAIATKAFGACSARGAIDFFAHAISVALARADANARGKIVLGSGGQIAACSHAPGDIAGLARSCAPIVATYTVDAEIAQAGTVRGTSLTIYAIAIIGPIARLRCSGAGSVVRAHRNGGTGAD